MPKSATNSDPKVCKRLVLLVLPWTQCGWTLNDAPRFGVGTGDGDGGLTNTHQTWHLFGGETRNHNMKMKIHLPPKTNECPWNNRGKCSNPNFQPLFFGWRTCYFSGSTSFYEIGWLLWNHFNRVEFLPTYIVCRISSGGVLNMYSTCTNKKHAPRTQPWPLFGQFCKTRPTFQPKQGSWLGSRYI